MTDEDARERNRRSWDAMAEVHPETDYYDLAAVAAGESSLYRIEREELADVVDDDTDLLHPMCHIGQDTVSWARECREVVGVDFSPASIERARELAAAAGVENVSFREGDVLEFDLDRTFDVVFNTFGVLGWLDDLDAWAGTLADHVRPGGHVYVADVHPVAGSFHHVGPDGIEFGEWSHSYFRADPIHVEDSGTYADADATVEHTETVQHRHTLGEAVTALADRGLRLEFLHEFPWADFRMFQGMTEDEAGRWWLPQEVAVDLPLTFSVRLRAE
jgi:SAM-dependent methyltransferase